MKTKTFGGIPPLISTVAMTCAPPDAFRGSTGLAKNTMTMAPADVMRGAIGQFNAKKTMAPADMGAGGGTTGQAEMHATEEHGAQHTSVHDVGDQDQQDYSVNA